MDVEAPMEVKAKVQKQNKAKGKKSQQWHQRTRNKVFHTFLPLKMPIQKSLVHFGQDHHEGKHLQNALLLKGRRGCFWPRVHCNVLSNHGV